MNIVVAKTNSKTAIVPTQQELDLIKTTRAMDEADLFHMIRYAKASAREHPRKKRSALQLVTGGAA